ncbi:uncharacterized protein GGS25DRAFT_486450 [Hypoxylon fragiforme]|uniref:uncharacterized protein n=1 Tax=Hypoxylon fragiforme TaxID=63214 RepID=UPI0020C6DE9F|nr:uncharacterized protein GGS25DRAFT_486450 [Hypoxylon fragiforme]KAI2609832.1 hypothetical protein GGS25DRAFT_486450 [Hypoxylon fragiforme]
MMGDIYRLTRRVVAFVGPEQADNDVGFDIFQRIGDSVEVDFGSSIVKPSPSGAASNPEWADMQQELGLNKQEISSIYNIIRYEWFERLWIRQEIGLGGSEGVLQYGHKQMKWEHFCKAIFIIKRKAIAADVVDAAEMEHFRHCLEKADNVALFSKRGFRFSNLRRQLGASKCSDPRDRIYGVMGQLRETDRIGIVPDYSKSVAEAYTDATRKYIQDFGKLLILSQCELRTTITTTPIPGLPSWVPDWSTGMVSLPIHAVLPPLFDILPAFSAIDDHTIQAYGIPCGTVARIIHVYGGVPPDAGLDDFAQELRRLLLAAEDDTIMRKSHRSREHILEAYTRTLWVDNLGDRWLPNALHEPLYLKCLSLVHALIESDMAWKDKSLLHQAELNRYLNSAHNACAGRALFVTEDGHIGLAPASIAPEDEICLLFTCPKPIALRPVPSTPGAPKMMQYKVVGESYLHDMMLGQALLGDLPAHLRGLLNANALMGLHSAGFVDVRTNSISQEDPRIQPFLSGLVERGLLEHPTVEELGERDALGVLQEAGYPVQMFDLV